MPADIPAALKPATDVTPTSGRSGKNGAFFFIGPADGNTLRAAVNTGVGTPRLFTRCCLRFPVFLSILPGILVSFETPMSVTVSGEDPR
jgi:hypothetical protein